MSENSASKLFLPSGLSLDGRKVLVTGAASGIGRATASCLAQLGADLVLTDRGSLDAVESEVRSFGKAPTLINGDLGDESFLGTLVEAGPYYSFANVAGVFQGAPGMAGVDAFDFVMHVNVRAPLVLAVALIDQMAENGGGFICLVGSAAGRNGGASSGGSADYAVYAASKGGVHTMVRWLSRRAVGKNVLVNGVAPGVVRTPLVETVASANVSFDKSLFPLGRMGEPSELGWPIALLCSPAASYMSGAVVDVNGGTFVG